MISDQLQQCQSCFTAQQGALDIKFHLQHRQPRSILVLQVKSKHSPEYYHLDIDHPYIQQHSQLSFFFETPEDIFYTLTELYQELTISPEGAITFQMKMNASKLKKKIITIHLNKFEQDQNSFMQLQFQRLSTEVRAQLGIRQNNLRVLTRKNQEQQQALQMLREEVRELRKEEESLILENKRQYFKMNGLTKENDFQRQEIFSLKRNLDYALNKIGNLQFFCFYENPHWHHFGVVKTQSSFKIIRKDNDNSWCNFIYNTPLRNNNVNGFKIRQTKSSTRNIMYGLGTRQLFGIPTAYKDPFSVAYSSNSGNLWEEGMAQKVGPQINDGQVVTIDVDLQSSWVLWMVDEVKIIKTTLPELLVKRELFLFLHMYNVGDEVELLIF